MNRFSGSATVPMDYEVAISGINVEDGECCHCDCRTRRMFVNVMGKRIAYACCFEHLQTVYPQYTTDATEWTE
jgi:hypothetical protein